MTETPKHLRGLNPPQREAVERTAGPLLVLAGAGTGKTRVVTTRIVQILHKGVPPSAICAVTFTNKAAREMRERVMGLLPGHDIRAMVVSTFHSLGLRILREFGQEIGGGKEATVADESDQSSILEDALREGGISRKAMHPKDAKWRISEWKNEGIDPEVVLERSHDPADALLAHVWMRYDEELRRRRLLDFDDLILMPLHLLRDDASARAALQDRWRYVMVDEYQDTNGCQFQFVRYLAGERNNLCVVGDDDQSIYGWRGADADRILRFTRDVPDAHVVTLEQNYRSTNQILEASHRLIENNLSRRPKKLWSALGEGEQVRLYVASDEKDEIDHLMSRLQMLDASGGEFSWNDCAILFRANSQCRPLETALRGREFPYRVVGTRSFFDRREVRDLLCFLRLARNPKDDSAFLRVANVPPRGIGKGSVDRASVAAAERRSSLYETIHEHPEVVSGPAQRGFEALHSALDTLRRAESFGEAFETFVEQIQYRDHLRQAIEDPLELDARLGIVAELIETASEPGPDGERRDLGSFLDALALREDKQSKREGKGNQEEEAITLITMHAAKGLEFPYVWIIGLEDGIVPHARSVAEAAAEGPGDDLTALEEERRLLYVGMTRAQRRLTLSYCSERVRFGKPMPTKPSRFLDEIDQETLEVMSALDETPADEESGKAWIQQMRSKFSETESWEDW